MRFQPVTEPRERSLLAACVKHLVRGCIHAHVHKKETYRRGVRLGRVQYSLLLCQEECLLVLAC